MGGSGVLSLQQPSPRLSAALGIAIAQERHASTLAEAIVGVEDLGYPLWVRSTGAPDPRFCMALDNMDDLPLAYAQATKRSGGNPVLLQRAVQGETYRVWYSPAGPIICLRTDHDAGSSYHIIDALASAPARDEFVSAAAGLREASGAEGEWMEAEYVIDSGRVFLTGWWLPESLHPAVRAVDEGGDAPRAVCWFGSRSGLVTEIAGLDDAIAVEGVIDTHVTVELGQVLTHVIDEATRDALGFVLATGDSANAALLAARAGAERVQVRTTSMLP